MLLLLSPAGTTSVRHSIAAACEARLEGREVGGRGEVPVGDDDRARLAQDRPQLGAGALQQARPDHDLVAARAELDRQPLARGHRASPTGSAASAASASATTAPIGPRPLSTIRSAWA